MSLLKAGIPVNNHTVLLKGVNDSLDTMRKLMRGLLRIKVRPYYIFIAILLLVLGISAPLSGRAWK